MKEMFLDEQQQANFDLQDRMIDDDYCCGEGCCDHETNTEKGFHTKWETEDGDYWTAAYVSEEIKSLDTEENEANKSAEAYDNWWNSLTNDQKEELFKDRDTSEKEMLDQMTDNDFFGPNKTAGI